VDGRDYYVVLGRVDRHNRWPLCRKYGFISASGGAPYVRLWDEGDVRNLRLTTDAAVSAAVRLNYWEASFLTVMLGCGPCMARE
jgi:hypothetical protein